MFFHKWSARARELEGQEEELKKSMPGHVAGILAPKRLLLWRELMVEFGYPDVGVFEEVVSGFKLTGNTPLTSIFPPTFKPSKRSLQDIGDWASDLRGRVLDRCKPQGEEDAIVHSKTIDERTKGWARGPISPNDLGSDSLVSRRFGLKQGPKTGLIDDLTMGGVNKLVIVHESPKPHGPDIVAGMLLSCMRELPGVELRGRAYDLRSAYRQLPIHLESLKHSYVAHWNEQDGAVEIDQLLALPFGASRSVYGFLRVVTSVWWLGCICLCLMWSVFFDDFVTIAREQDVRHTESAATAFFRLLGWDFDDCGVKAVSFDLIFKALGVSFDLTAAAKGAVTIANTESRIAELCQTIGEILACKTLSKAAALRLRGRMQFCDSFVFGRSSKLCLQAVTQHAHESVSEKVGDDLRASLFRFETACRLASLMLSRHHMMIRFSSSRMLATSPVPSGAQVWALPCLMRADASSPSSPCM